MKLRMGAGRLAASAFIAVALVVGAVMLARKLGHGATANADVQVQTVERQDIRVTIEATGTVEPIDLVEVKSKASGQIINMPVQVGSVVKAGELLAQIDKVNVQNQYDQAYAALHAAQAKADISQAQKKRSDDLFAQGVITADEHEAATIDYANAQASLVKARTDLDTARQALADATVRAPVAGTILQQLVTVGQVIASATSSVSGGTALLDMADLSRIRLRALVAETDIGSVQPGQAASVTVDAYPQRPFDGRVEKIEPQAIVQQSVTMFPVLISISNERGLLLPGMNGEVSMLIAERDGVLAVPLDAVRTVRELPAVAAALGLPADATVAKVRQQLEARSSQAAADSGRSGGMSARGTAVDPAGGARGRGDSTATRGRFRRTFGDSAARARWMASGGANGAGRRWMRGGPGTGGGSSAQGSFGSGDASARGASGFGGGGASGGTAGNGSGSGRGGGGGRAQVVFVKTATGLEPRVVRLGLSNYDYVQVLDGVSEGDQVAMLAVAELQAKRQQDQDRLRQRMSSGMPGVSSGGGAGRGGGGGGGAARTGGR